MIINQISVFVENKRGRLAEITKVLENSKVDIRALSIADTRDFGILRLIVADSEKAISALKTEGFTVSITKVIGIGIDDHPGGLSKAMEVLNENEIGVEYMYAFISRNKDTAYVILRVEDNQKAIEVLQANKFNVLKADSI